MKDVVAQLKRFIAELKKRDDIEVGSVTIGKPATKAQLKANDHLPPDVLEFFALMNGIEISWDFTENSSYGHGELNIPPLSAKEPQAWKASAPDRELDFGKNTQYWLIDLQIESHLTYLVRTSSKTTKYKVYSSDGDKDDEAVVPGGLAGYLTQGMACGFVNYWPACRYSGSDYEYIQEEIDRFKKGTSAKGAAPKTAKLKVPEPARLKELKAGQRVQVWDETRCLRGVVISKHTLHAIGGKSIRPSDWAVVRLDDGFTFAVDRWSLFEVADDLYEHATIANLPAVPDGPEKSKEYFNEMFARIGIIDSYSCADTRVLGIMMRSSYTEAVDYYLRFKAFYDKNVQRLQRPDVPDRKDMFDRYGWSLNRSELLSEDLIKRLLLSLRDALRIFTCSESIRLGVPGNQLLDAERRANLGFYEFTLDHVLAPRYSELALMCWDDEVVNVEDPAEREPDPMANDAEWLGYLRERAGSRKKFRAALGLADDVGVLGLTVQT